MTQSQKQEYHIKVKATIEVETIVTVNSDNLMGATIEARNQFRAKYNVLYGESTILDSTLSMLVAVTKPINLA